MWSTLFSPFLGYTPAEYSNQYTELKVTPTTRYFDTGTNSGTAAMAHGPAQGNPWPRMVEGCIVDTQKAAEGLV